MADSCTLHAALAIRQATTVTHADVPTVETVANRHVFRRPYRSPEDDAVAAITVKDMAPKTEQPHSALTLFTDFK